jgi:Bacterial capsule synthesis protein PGA_cap
MRLKPGPHCRNHGWFTVHNLGPAQSVLSWRTPIGSERGDYLYLPNLLPLPWRVLAAWEQVALQRHRFGAAPAEYRIRRGSKRATLVATGDLALLEPTAGDAPATLGELLPVLRAADIRIGNLEAVITTRQTRASGIGSAMRAPPTALQALAEAGFDVLTVANNHALDYGSEALEECLALLRSRNIGACGAVVGAALQQPVVRRVNSLRVGFLGFCDDHAPVAGSGGARPCIDDARATGAAIAAARGEVDVLVVQMHWGYEFTLHPLRRHRDAARRMVEAGAHAVICHHAHVPQGIEIWRGSPIAYGLGNAVMPMNDYMREGHPWADRSFVLELGLHTDGIGSVKLHPFRIPADTPPQLLGGRARRQLLAALATMSKRLVDDRFLARCEGARLRYESLRLLANLRELAARDGPLLGEGAAALRLPRQQRLLEHLAGEPATRWLSSALQSIADADDPAAMRALLAGNAARFSDAANAVARGYGWRDALRCRLP